MKNKHLFLISMITGFILVFILFHKPVIILSGILLTTISWLYIDLIFPFFNKKSYWKAFTKFDFSNEPIHYIGLCLLFIVLIVWLLQKDFYNFKMGFSFLWVVYNTLFWIGYSKDYKNLEDYDN